ncbi:MAG: cytidine deaminase [Peptococcaceae bacterium]|jgi:dCMP deaminase|nr:cytidine deaminase [Peptococcaceae bacterium]
MRSKTCGDGEAPEKTFASGKGVDRPPEGAVQQRVSSGLQETSAAASRPDWDEYFMEIARVVASRSTCLRRSVGALIVKDTRILASGYNGAPAGLRHCLETGCLREERGVPAGERHELCRGLHAEQNALIQAAVYGIAIQGAVYYVTHQPCALCAKIMINAGIRKVVFQGDYPDPLALKLFEEAEVVLVRFGGSSCAKKEHRFAEIEQP